MLAFFERLVDPYPDAQPAPPPSGFFAFLWECSRGLRKYLLATVILTGAIGAFEALLFAFLGNIVDWLAKVEPAQLWTQERRTFCCWAACSPRACCWSRCNRRSSSKRCSATFRCCCAGTSTGSCSRRAYTSIRTNSLGASRPR